MKMDILREANYIYNFDQAIFVNRDSRKAFSFPFIDDHSETELAQFIQENTDRDHWKFYFNFPPTDRVRRELESLLN